MQSASEVEEVSLLELKAMTKRLLPYGSLARSIIEAEPDSVSKAEWEAKAPILIALIHNEIKETR